jgi:hypothetical protein
MTMHHVKAMEFAKVSLLGVSGKSLPRAYLIDTLPEEDRARSAHWGMSRPPQPEMR